MALRLRAHDPHARLEGFLVQEMIDGTEMILGAREDPQPGITGMIVATAAIDVRPWRRLAYLPKRADIVAFHDKYYHPNNAILVFGGDITAEKAFALAEQNFGAWKKGAVPASTSTPRAAAVWRKSSGSGAATRSV